MRKPSRSFHSKLLLFGEYGLMFGAQALSVPFRRFSGKLEVGKQKEGQGSHRELQKFYTYLRKNDLNSQLHFPIDLAHFVSDLNGGLFFRSDIPLQYGVGSSGALVAALVDEYAQSNNQQKSPEFLQADFALLESYFHGKSSGLDPLISYLNKPVLLDSHKRIHLPESNPLEAGWYMALLDTQTTGATGPLVQHFRQRYETPEFRAAFGQEFLPANDGCIDAMLANQPGLFFSHLEKLVHFQLRYMQRMIPGPFRELIRDALKKQIYIKLLGSGGGGFLLAFARQKSILEDWGKSQNYPLICL